MNSINEEKYALLKEQHEVYRKDVNRNLMELIEMREYAQIPWIEFLFESYYLTGFSSDVSREYARSIVTCKNCGNDFHVTCDKDLCDICGDSEPYLN